MDSNRIFDQSSMLSKMHNRNTFTFILSRSTNNTHIIHTIYIHSIYNRVHGLQSFLFDIESFLCNIFFFFLKNRAAHCNLIGKEY